MAFRLVAKSCFISAPVRSVAEKWWVAIVENTEILMKRHGDLSASEISKFFVWMRDLRLCGKSRIQR